MNTTDHLRLRSNVYAREFDDETILVDLEHGDYFGLDEIGSRALQLFIAGKSVGEAAVEIVGQYEVTEVQAIEDLVALAEELVRRKLVDVIA
jgi:hypothetical protein